VEMDTYYVVHPEFLSVPADGVNGGRRVREGFSYASDTNPHKLTVEEVRDLLGSLDLL
jgi:hypothetical protein